MSTKSTTCFGKMSGQPLTEFSSKSDADAEVAYQNIYRQKDMVSYRCIKCGKWHLSPKERQTPSVPCDFCRGKSGNAKELYDSEEDALNRAEILLAEHGSHLRAYRCPHMSGWHLTSSGAAFPYTFSTRRFVIKRRGD